ncbi:MAG: transglutaminase domain-containing protein [Candidatus Thermoplasmatota archaeon]
MNDNLKIYIALIIIFLFLFSSFFYLKFFSKKNEYREGFKFSELKAPIILSYEKKYDEKPNSSLSFGPGYKYEVRWTVEQVYVYWGGSIEIWIKNVGDNRLFLYGFGILVDEKLYSKNTGLYLGSNEVYLGILGFESPEKEGNYTYTLKFSILAEGKKGWYDYGMVGEQKNNLTVMQLGKKVNYENKKNVAYYYDKVKNLLKNRDLSVKSKAQELASKYPGSYNTHQIAEVFGYVKKEIKYIREREGRDYWAKPHETIALGAGDCEDQALLLSALLIEIGANVRFHITKDHAFISVYFGKDTTLLNGLDKYYETNLTYSWFEDKFGIWVTADPTSSIYLGSLPGDSEPVAKTKGGAKGVWELTNTTVLYDIDVRV